MGQGGQEKNSNSSPGSSEHPEDATVPIKGITSAQTDPTSSRSDQVEEVNELVGWTDRPRSEPLGEGKSSAKSKKKKGRKGPAITGVEKKKGPDTRENGQQSAQGRAGGQAGGSNLVQQGGADKSKSPSRKQCPQAKGKDVPQNKVAGGFSHHLHVNRNNKCESYGAPGNSGASNQGNRSVQEVSVSPACSQIVPVSADWQVPGTTNSGEGDNQSCKLDVAPVVPASSSGWDVDPGPTLTDNWEDLVDGGDDQHYVEDKKGTALPTMKSYLSFDMDYSGKSGVTGNGLDSRFSYPQNRQAETECASDEEWETVPIKKQMGARTEEDTLFLQEGKGKTFEDNDINARSVGNVTGDFELNAKNLGGSNGNASPKVARDNGKQQQLSYSTVIARECDHGSGRRKMADTSLSLIKGWLKVSPCRQGDLTRSSTTISGETSSERDVSGDTNSLSSGEHSESGIKVDYMNTTQCPSRQELALESIEQPDELERYPVCSYSDSQSSDLDDAEDDYDVDYMSDDWESDESVKSHETQKKVKWFCSFFQDLGRLTEEQLQEHSRQWHCPACKGGVGAIDWFRGLGPLVSHARTMRSRRVKLHQMFGEILEEEMRLRGTGAGSGGRPSAYGQWKGLQTDSEAQNPLIMWPPMVIIQNTKLEIDGSDKWLGMGNNELLNYFRDYNPVKARHAYGPKGHRGMSLLLFKESPSGYHAAQRLHKHFTDARRSLRNWESPGKLIYHPGGNGSRILYGYLATKEDIEVFNRHSKGKSVIKYTFKRLQEVVVEPMRIMDDQKQKVMELQTTVEKVKEVSKTLKKTVTVVARNLQLREKEIQVLRTRAEEQFVRNKQQQSDLEDFFKINRNQMEEYIVQKEAELRNLREKFKEAHLEQCEKLELKRSEFPKRKGLSKDEQQHQEALMDEEITREAQLLKGSINEA